jgi:hypothetical protein
MGTALVAATIAASAAIVAASVSWFGAFQVRRTADRQHAWDRFVWALRGCPDDVEYDISRRVLDELTDVAWWSRSDRRLAVRALRRVASTRTTSPSVPDGFTATATATAPDSDERNERDAFPEAPAGRT